MMTEPAADLVRPRASQVANGYMLPGREGSAQMHDFK